MNDLKWQFERFHEKNPQVYEMFERYTFSVIHAGRKKFGAKAIMERVRFYSAVETTGEVFKINNNYSAAYARMFVEHHPEYEFFFETRKSFMDEKE